MTDDPTTPDAADEDDAVVDAFAAELEARAAQDPAFARLLLRAVKGEKLPSEMTQEELAAHWGTDRNVVNRVAVKACKILEHTPELVAIHKEWFRRPPSLGS